MKKIYLCLFITVFAASANAACPTGYTEVHMENMVYVDSGASCPANTVVYYEIPDICNAHIH